MDGLGFTQVMDVVERPEVASHRKDPTWTQVFLAIGWALVWVTGILLLTLVSWKVVIPWLFLVSG